MKKNDIVTLEIEDITNLGFGVGKVDGAVVFVASCIPKDIVEVKIIKAASSYYVGRVEKYIKKSPNRVLNRCENTRCHSCTYKYMDYKEELLHKENTVRSGFVKEGLSDVVIEPVIPSPKLTEYRNKAQYPISRDKNGEYVIGFYAPKSHTVCEASECCMAPEIFALILKKLKEVFKKYSLSVYDENSGEGLLRHIYIRRSETLGEILLTLVINGNSIPHSGQIVDEIRAQFPQICGILLNINKKNTNVILGEKFVTIYGKDYICDTLAGVKLKITAESFYQVNHGTATLIYEEARKLANLNKDDTLLDLYCGAGSIGLSMAKDAKELIGIEIVDRAVECAVYNAKENMISNARFYTGDAKNTEAFLLNAEKALNRKIEPDVIILDPPRSGCAKELIDFIDKLSAKKVVYISCNPLTLARDMKIFKEKGYSFSSVKLFDMFPMTGHVESVVCLKRQIQQ